MVDVGVEICDLVGVGANLNTRVTTISVLRMARWGREEYLERRGPLALTSGVNCFTRPEGAWRQWKEEGWWPTLLAGLFELEHSHTSPTLPGALQHTSPLHPTHFPNAATPSHQH